MARRGGSSVDPKRAGNLQSGTWATLNRPSGLAIAAGLALVPADYAIVAAAFLYRPLGGEIVLAVVAAVFLLGISLRRPRLIYASQAIAIAPTLVRMVERPQDISVGGVLMVVGAAVGIAALAWTVARAFPPRSQPDVE